MEPNGTENAETSGGAARASRRERVRAVGLSGDRWYAVELERNLPRGAVKEVVFWKTSIALYRGADGEVRAVENRCAHRQLRLTRGQVEGNLLVCNYHGWKYDGCGKCVEVSHEIGARSALPDIRIRSYPVRTRYGFVWIFPGDPAKADAAPLPSIPELEGDRPWPYEPIDLTIDAHFSMILENVCDFNHAYLHRRLRPFVKPKLERFWREGDAIFIEYLTDFAQGQLAKALAERQGSGLDRIRLWYRYPFQGSDIGGKYLHHLFMVPIDERTTRCFFVFLFGPLEIPGLRWKLPEVLRKPALKAATLAYIRPLLGEDKWALEEEQLAHDRHARMPAWEFNPIVRAFQKLTLEQWDAYVASEAARLEALPASQRATAVGAGLGVDDLQRAAALRVERESDDHAEAAERALGGAGVAAE